MKKLIVSLAVLGLFLGLVGIEMAANVTTQYAQKIEETLSEKRYVDQKGFFEIIPPANWRVQEYIQDIRGKVAFMGPESNLELRILASQKDFSSFEELYSILQENVKDIEKRFKISVTFQKISFLDRPAIKREYELRGVKFFAIEFMAGNVRHDLQYSAPQKLYDKYLPIVLKAMDTYEPIPVGVSGEDFKKAGVANKLRLACLFFEQGSFNLALEYVKEGLEIDPQNEELLKLKGEIITESKHD